MISCRRNDAVRKEGRGGVGRGCVEGRDGARLERGRKGSGGARVLGCGRNLAIRLLCGRDPHGLADTALVSEMKERERERGVEKGDSSGVKKKEREKNKTR